MKKIVYKIAVFLIFFLLFSVILNSVFLAVIASTDWDFMKRRQSLNFENPEFELLVLGASMSEYAFDTEALTSSGVKSFNLSLVGNSVKTAYVQISEYLSMYQIRPTIVILGVNSFLEDFDGEGIQPVVEFTMKGHKYGIKDIPITKFNWAGMELLKKAVLSEYRKTTVTFGHKKSIKTIPDNSGYESKYLELKKYESALWINKIAELCNSYEIEFVIIDLPGVKETQNDSSIGPYAINFGDGSEAILFNLNSREFCNFIDYDKDWAGLSHFNKFGAKRFTEKLINIFVAERVIEKNIR